MPEIHLPDIKIPSRAAKSAELGISSLNQCHHHLNLWQAPYTFVELKNCSREDVHDDKPQEQLKDSGQGH